VVDETDLDCTPPSDRNCACRGTSSIKCNEFSNLLNYKIKNLRMTKCDTFIKPRRTCFSTCILFVLVFYTLKHVLPEMTLPFAAERA